MPPMEERSERPDVDFVESLKKVIEDGYVSIEEFREMAEKVREICRETREYIKSIISQSTFTETENIESEVYYIKHSKGIIKNAYEACESLKLTLQAKEGHEKLKGIKNAKENIEIDSSSQPGSKTVDPGAKIASPSELKTTRPKTEPQLSIIAKPQTFTEVLVIDRPIELEYISPTTDKGLSDVTITPAKPTHDQHKLETEGISETRVEDSESLQSEIKAREESDEHSLPSHGDQSTAQKSGRNRPPYLKEECRSWLTHEFKKRLPSVMAAKKGEWMFMDQKSIPVHIPGGFHFATKLEKPCVSVVDGMFRVSLDISRYESKNISLYVGDGKLHINAVQKIENKHGYEYKTLDQVFTIPPHVDKKGFKARITTEGELLVDSPIVIPKMKVQK